ncbi:MAG: YqhA family protein [Gammaproteobacteria bacterium]
MALALLSFKFLQELMSCAPTIITLSSDDTVLAVLSLIDLVLVGNLVLLVIFAGYENLVSKIETSKQPDRPSWLGTVDMSALKLSLIASIIAISAIQFLKSFMHMEQLTDRQLAWQAGYTSCSSCPAFCSP